MARSQVMLANSKSWKIQEMDYSFEYLKGQKPRYQPNEIDFGLPVSRREDKYVLF